MIGGVLMKRCGLLAALALAACSEPAVDAPPVEIVRAQPLELRIDAQGE